MKESCVMKKIFLAIGLALGVGQLAHAQEGAYFGLGAGVNFNSAVSSEVSFFQATSTDFSLALTAGYRLPQMGAGFWGVELNLDFATGELLADGNQDACTNVSPNWCNIDGIARLRATYGHGLGDGSMLMGSLGVASVRGRLEQNPGEYVDATGTGFSLGVAWEKPLGDRAVRLDLNYDFIDDDDHPTYPRELEIIGLRVSYMF